MAKTPRSKKSVKKSMKKSVKKSSARIGEKRSEVPAVHTYSFSDVQEYHNGQGTRKTTELVNGKGKTFVATFPDGKVFQKRITG